MRGVVYGLRAGRDTRGHEQQGRRYGVVVSSSRFDHLSRWIVAPTSSSQAATSSILRPVVDWGSGRTSVLCDAIQSVDPQARLGEEVGYLSLDEMRRVDQALSLLLDLPRPN